MIRLDSSRALLLRLMLLAVLVLTPPILVSAWRAWDGFSQGLAPELDLKAEVIVRDLVGQVERAVGYGIPVDRLVGVDDFFEQVLHGNPEIRYLSITAPDGAILFLNGALSEQLEGHYRARIDTDTATLVKSTPVGFIDLSLPVMAKDRMVARVHVGADGHYIAGRLWDVMLDVAVVLAVFLVVGFEILLFVVVFNISGPMKLIAQVVAQGRKGDFTRVPGTLSGDEVGGFVRSFQACVRHLDGSYRRLMAYIEEVRGGHFDRDAARRAGEIADRVRYLFRFNPQGAPQVLREKLSSDVRLPLFLFVFAEELSRSFLPLYAQTLSVLGLPLAPDLLMALPIAVFMAGIALGSLWAGAVTERLGSRRVFLLGLVPALLGAVMSGFAQSLPELALWRGIAGLGYALITVACQSYISKTTVEGSRAAGLGAYVGAILTASLCGAAGGAVLAERLGFAATFLVSAALIAVSGWLLGQLLARQDTPPAAVAMVSGRPLLRIFINWRFTVLVVFAAIPAKIALTGYLFFLVPVILWNRDLSLPQIGQIMALYPLVMLAVSWYCARLADRLGWRIGQVALGGLIGGAGILSLALGDGIWPLVLGIVGLAVSHGMGAAPILAVLPDICWIECKHHGRTQVMALLRTCERVGSVLGPLLAAAFLPFWGERGAVLALGGVVLSMAVVFALASGAYGSGPHLMTEEDEA